MNLKDLTQQELYDTTLELEQQAKNIKLQLDPLREEIHRRMLEDGVKGEEYNGFIFTLKQSPLSAAWLKRNGYEPQDIPSQYVGEKVVPEINWAGVRDWLGNPPLEYSLTITRKKGI